MVLSHWVLDFIVHGPDLPLLFGGSPLVGLGLWTSGAGLNTGGILEVGLLAGDIAIYWAARRRAKARTRPLAKKGGRCWRLPPMWRPRAETQREAAARCTSGR